MNLSWMDQYIDGVIEYCGSNDVFEIYETLNINIKKVDKDDLLLQENDSVYVRNYLGIEVVFIRDDLPYKYEKFVLAHELGHAILHIDVASAAYSNKLLNKGKLEHEANYFALRLLNISIDSVYYDGYTYEQLAREFCVTESSLEYCY